MVEREGLDPEEAFTAGIEALDAWLAAGAGGDQAGKFRTRAAWRPSHVPHEEDMMATTLNSTHPTTLPTTATESVAVHAIRTGHVRVWAKQIRGEGHWRRAPAAHLP